jgi:threonine/homoserine/homoserine lactone efflux protein
MKNLPIWQNQMYLLLYIFIFMLDDLIIFFVIMKTMQLKGISSKYSRWSNLIGGIMILLIGLLLIFKPEWLMFG